MGIITKTVKVKPSRKSVNHYRNKGYDAKYGKEIEVKVEDLTPSNSSLVLTFCDYCGKEKPLITYANYMIQTKNGTRKCCCVNCAPLKREETSLERYGYKSTNQVPEIKEKIKKTNLERYGETSPSKNSIVREKQKQTLVEHYGVDNPSLSKEVQEKRKQTFIEHYGVSNPLLCSEIKEKANKTILERYGVDNVSKNSDIQNKKKETFIEKLGVTSPLKSEKCLEKLKQTNLKKYGCEYTLQNEEIREKGRQTNLKKYGSVYPSQNSEIKEKIKQTNLKKYGVESILKLPEFHEHSRIVDMEKYGVYHHLQNPEILSKQKNTFYKNDSCPTSKQQKYLHNLYGGELNYPFKSYNMDICIPDKQLNIEYDGSGHNMNVVFGNMSQKEFNRKEMIRNIIITKAGYKQIRILSLKDRLPSDDVLKQMLSDSLEYFSKYPNHSWCKFDIDKSLFINAENKDGIFYQFGYLRKISDFDIAS